MCYDLSWCLEELGVMAQGNWAITWVNNRHFTVNSVAKQGSVLNALSINNVFDLQWVYLAVTPKDVKNHLYHPLC